MSKNQIELIIALILLSLYLIALIVLRFGFKIKRNVKLEGKIKGKILWLFFHRL